MTLGVAQGWELLCPFGAMAPTTSTVPSKATWMHAC